MRNKTFLGRVNRSTYRTVGSLMVAGILLTAFSASASAAAKKPVKYKSEKLTMQVNIPSGGALQAWINSWASTLKRKSKGAISIQQYGEGALYQPATSVPAVQNGQLDLDFVDIGSLYGTLPGFEAAVLPLVGTTDTKLFDFTGPTSPLFKPLTAYAKAHGLTLLPTPLWLPGQQSIMLKNHITSLSDLSGQKIRSLGGLFDTLLQGLGASPIDLTGTEVPSALSSGTVSGAFGSASVMDSTWKGLGNTDIPLGTVSPGGYYLLANRKEWAALGTADQNLLTTSWEAEFKLFQPVAPSLESQQEQIFAATSGNQIYKLKAADITKLDQISSGIWKSFKTPFPAFYKDAVSAAKMFKIKTPVSAA